MVVPGRYEGTARTARTPLSALFAHVLASRMAEITGTTCWHDALGS
jgi:hypothetical protein